MGSMAETAEIWVKRRDIWIKLKVTQHGVENAYPSWGPPPPNAPTVMEMEDVEVVEYGRGCELGDGAAWYPGSIVELRIAGEPLLLAAPGAGRRDREKLEEVFGIPVTTDENTIYRLAILIKLIHIPAAQPA